MLSLALNKWAQVLLIKLWPAEFKFQQKNWFLIILFLVISFYKTGLNISNVIYQEHTCHKLWTKICEIRQNFKGNLTKNCATIS